jgi:hypothetical protein
VSNGSSPAEEQVAAPAPAPEPHVQPDHAA